MECNTWKLYVIHFDKPYKHAKHYTGIAMDVEKRMKKHRAGRGARLLQVLKEHDIGFRYNIIAEYPTYSLAKAEEKRLKTKIKKPQRYCPICKEETRAEARHKTWRKKIEKLKKESYAKIKG